MMRNYQLTKLAEQDIEEIVVYIAEENPAAAYKLLDSFYRAMDLLSDNPCIGHYREDLTNQPVRFWSVKSHYLIIYRDTSPIEIIRVLSGYRDIATIL